MESDEGVGSGGVEFWQADFTGDGGFLGDGEKVS